jgi:hypothetical protein
VSDDFQKRSLESGSIICADWGKPVSKRAVYVADIGTHSIRRLRSDAGWSVTEILAISEQLSSRGPVLVGFDVPFGVPHSYFSSARTVLGWGPLDTFVDFLHSASRTPNFFESTSSADNWRVEQPFFAVPSGEGSLAAFRNAAARQGVELLRRVDRATKAKSLFITSGIPGSVGSAAASLWQEIARLREKGRKFRMWPFEGDIGALLRNNPITFAEVYPRAAYSTALLEGSPTHRPPLALAKTDANVRYSAIETLMNSSWVRLHEVRIENLDEARMSEDDFDACVTAAALLRCQLEALPLYPDDFIDRIEGGILGTGGVNLFLKERSSLQSHRPATLLAFPKAPARKTAGPCEGDVFRCPIEGCGKVYRGTRGGWDAHVASIRNHPHWSPDLSSPADRKARFKIEFPEFFGSHPS